MKITFLVFILMFVFCRHLYSQSAVASPEQIEKFYKTKTCVVLDDDIFNNYNNKIRQAVELNWKITPFEFISLTEYYARCKSEKYSFLIRTKAVFEKDEYHVPYTYLSLVMGGKYSNVNKMPTLSDFPLSYYNVDYEKYDYKLGAVVLFMQNHVKLCKEHPELNEKNVLKYYNKNIKSIKGKILYILKDELDKDVKTLNHIQKYYKGTVKLVSPEDIIQAIKEKNNEIVFLHKVGPPKGATKKERVYKLIIGVSDAVLYYFDYHKYKKDKKEDAFLKGDFENLEKE